MQINIKTSTSWHYVQSTKNKNPVKFLQHIKKKIMQLPLCSIVMQNIWELKEFQSCSLLLVYGWLWSKTGVNFLDQGTLKSAIHQE